jgi:sugar phosphate isomerase/epimerase
MKIGVNTLCYAACRMEEAIDRMTSDGFEAVHLFLDFEGGQYFPFPYDPQRVAVRDLSPARCREIRRAFEQAGLEIAALGGYTDLIEPDEARRRANIADLRELIARTHDLGTSIVATESGQRPSLQETKSATSQQRLLTSIRELIPDLETHDVVLALESYDQTTLDTSRRLRQVVDVAGSNRVRALLDPGNTFVTDTLAETFGCCGDIAVAAHAKDVSVVAGDLRPALMGSGQVDHREYHRLLRQHDFEGPWILDLTEGEDLRQAREHLKAIVT